MKCNLFIFKKKCCNLINTLQLNEPGDTPAHKMIVAVLSSLTLMSLDKPNSAMSDESNPTHNKYTKSWPLDYRNDVQ